MLILVIRTDKSEAEIGLYEDETKLAYEIWQAHRQLASTLHEKIDGLLRGQKKELKDLGGIVCFTGPGSFTGLRIGLTVADVTAYGLDIPIIGSQGEVWLDVGIKRLLAGEDDRIVLPNYGAPVHITQQKK